MFATDRIEEAKLPCPCTTFELLIRHDLNKWHPLDHTANWSIIAVIVFGFRHPTFRFPSLKILYRTEEQETIPGKVEARKAKAGDGIQLTAGKPNGNHPSEIKGSSPILRHSTPPCLLLHLVMRKTCKNCLFHLFHITLSWGHTCHFDSDLFLYRKMFTC